MKTEDIPVEEWQKLADWVKEVLMMQAAECAREFEKLPILENVEILRNILYSGVWVKYEMIHRKRTETGETKGK